MARSAGRGACTWSAVAPTTGRQTTQWWGDSIPAANARQKDVHIKVCVRAAVKLHSSQLLFRLQNIITASARSAVSRQPGKAWRPLKGLRIRPIAPWASNADRNGNGSFEGLHIKTSTLTIPLSATHVTIKGIPKPWRCLMISGNLSFVSRITFQQTRISWPPCRRNWSPYSPSRKCATRCHDTKSRQAATHVLATWLPVKKNSAQLIEWSYV